MDNLSIKLRRFPLFVKIRQFWLKYEAKIMLVIGFVMVAILAFQFGFIEGKNKQSSPILIESPVDSLSNAPSEPREAASDASPEPQKSPTSVETSPVGKDTVPSKCAFVGSKNSDKYYPPTCQWAKRIKPENITCFESKEAAEAQGRVAGKGC